MKNGPQHFLKNIRLLVGLLAALYFAAPLLAQQPFFRTHDLGEPYNQATIHCIFQSANHKIWLGTDMGLLFYDGFDAQPFLTLNGADEIITAIAADANDVVWAGAASGMLYRVNESLKGLEQTEGPALPSSITAIANGKDNYLYIATYKNGIYEFRDGQLAAMSAGIDADAGDVYALEAVGEQLWVGADRGLLCLSRQGESGAWQQDKQASADLPKDIVRKINIDVEGNLWIGTYGGMVARRMKDQRDWKRFQLPNGGVVQSIASVNANEVWVATENNGSWVLDPTEGKWIPLNDIKGKASALFYDTEGNLWFASDKAGLQSASRFLDYLHLDFKDVQTVLHTTEGIWLGTKQGLYLWDIATARLIDAPKALSKSNIISLYEDKYKNIWAGTFGQGIQLYDPKGKQLRRLDIAEGLTNGSILDMAGIDKRLWLATLGGVMEIHLDQNPFEQKKLEIKNYNQNSDLGTNFIYCVYPDKKGRVWFGTNGKGLCVLENGKLTTVANYKTDDLQYDFPTVYSITEDFQGNIWFSTPANEVFRYDGSKFYQLARKSALQTVNINGLATDQEGQILILHDEGIDQLNPESNRLVYFDEFMGLKDFRSNPNAFSNANDNIIWIASTDYLVRYQSLANIENLQPKTVITSVTAARDLIDWQAKRSFAHNQNQFIIRYAGLWYTNPADLEYRYRLAGYEEEWRYTKDAVATYPALSPGDYTFEVMSTENSSFVGAGVMQYAFDIDPPFWRTWWFISLMVLLIGSSFYAYVKLRDQRVRHLERLKKEKAESQLETLKTQINPHFLFNNFNTLISIIEDDPKIAVEYVEHLSDFYRSILKYREQSWVTLSEELKTLENYAFLLRKRFGDSFSLEVNVDNLELKVIPLCLQRLVENALKHNEVSKSKTLRILIQQSGNEILVSNNVNPKLKPAKSTGFGLSSIKSEYELMSQGQVEVNSSKHKFEVKLPAI